MTVLVSVGIANDRDSSFLLKCGLGWGVLEGGEKASMDVSAALNLHHWL